MNLKAFVTTMIVGAAATASSVAMADSFTAQASWGIGASVGSNETTVRDHRHGDRPQYYQPAYNPPISVAPIAIQPVREDMRYQRSAVTLASALRFPDGTREVINVGGKLGRFGTLKIEAARGATLIRQIAVQFEDNDQRQVFKNLNATLTGDRPLVLDLAGNRRPIKFVVVYAENASGGYTGDHGHRYGHGNAAINVSAM